MSLSEAEEQLITILKQVIEKLTPTNVEVTHLMMATVL